MDIWTADGQLTAVKAESAWDGTDSFDAPTAATVSALTAYGKGAFVTFEKLANGNIGDVKAVGTEYALLGTYVNKDGETELTLDADGLSGAGSLLANITKDTKVIYVDTDAVAGAEGGEIALAQQTAISTAYVLNVVAHATDGTFDADNE